MAKWMYNIVMNMEFKKLDNELIYEDFKKYYGAAPKVSDTIDIYESDNNVVMLKFKIFENMEFVRQGFSTRIGGVSSGIYSTMNLTYGRNDEPCNVRKNFDIIGETIGISPERMVYSKQTHTCNILKVEECHCGMGVTGEQDYDNIDGLVTDKKNICLVTAYADCIPVIMADPVKRVVAAAHAGWRGTVGNIAKNVVDVMVQDYGCGHRDIKAFVGPGICVDCYEVGTDVAKEFKAAYSESELDMILKLKQEHGKYKLNLPMANVINLQNAGLNLENINVADICTCCNPQILFSHRATKGERGIMCNFIAIR